MIKLGKQTNKQNIYRLTNHTGIRQGDRYEKKMGIGGKIEHR